MRVPDAENRIFEVNIKIPGITVFKGEISFGLQGGATYPPVAECVSTEASDSER